MAKYFLLDQTLQIHVHSRRNVTTRQADTGPGQTQPTGLRSSGPGAGGTRGAREGMAQEAAGDARPELPAQRGGPEARRHADPKHSHDHTEVSGAHAQGTECTVPIRSR